MIYLECKTHGRRLDGLATSAVCMLTCCRFFFVAATHCEQLFFEIKGHAAPSVLPLLEGAPVGPMAQGLKGRRRCGGPANATGHGANAMARLWQVLTGRPAVQGTWRYPKAAAAAALRIATMPQQQRHREAPQHGGSCGVEKCSKVEAVSGRKKIILALV